MLNVKFEDFAKEFASELQIEDDNFFKVPLKDVKQFDSMGKITASLVIESLFSFEIDLDILDDVETLESLYEYCISKKS